jgi:tetratricopeptide (TPR) repeat protein
MMDHSRIAFLPVPESLRGHVESLSGYDFVLDPAIPIPVEVTGTDFDLNNLSWEMIVSGMMAVVADEPDAEHAEYYRRFIITVRPGIVRELSAAAILKAKNGDYDVALDIIDMVQAVFPDFPQLSFDRALVLEERALCAGQKTGSAINLACEAYEKALLQNPSVPEVFYHASFFFMKHKHFARAKDCFLTYLSLSDDPEKKEQIEAILHNIDQTGLDDASFQEAYTCISTGDVRQGLEHIRSFLERYPDVWNAWFMLGWGLRKLHRFEDGQAAFYKALELGGDTSDTRNELAICLMETGNFAGARAELENALRKDGENIKIISNLGALALKMGRTDEAAAFFRTVLALEPEDQVALAYLHSF